jgi:glutathione S-transferase
MKLYDADLSGNCYKVRLLLALLERPYEKHTVNLPAGEHKQPAYLAINPLGQVPALEDGEVVLHDSQAIVTYLARKYGGDAWLPESAEGLGRVMQWLSLAANEVARGPNDARLHDKFGAKIDVAGAREKAHRLLAAVEAHLADKDWLEMGRPTVADIACFPYIALSHEGGVALDAYPAVRAWIARIKALPNFVPMAGLA